MGRGSPELRWLLGTMCVGEHDSVAGNGIRSPPEQSRNVVGGSGESNLRPPTRHKSVRSENVSARWWNLGIRGSQNSIPDGCRRWTADRARLRCLVELM